MRQTRFVVCRGVVSYSISSRSCCYVGAHLQRHRLVITNASVQKASQVKQRLVPFRFCYLSSLPSVSPIEHRLFVTRQPMSLSVVQSRSPSFTALTPSNLFKPSDHGGSHPVKPLIQKNIHSQPRTHFIQNRVQLIERGRHAGTLGVSCLEKGVLNVKVRSLSLSLRISLDAVV